MEYRPSIRGWWSTWPHRYCFINAYIDPIDICLAIRVIDFNDHLNQFSRHVSILFKMNVCTRNTFAQTTTTRNLSLWSFLLSFYHSALSQSYLSGKFYLSTFCHSLNGNSHLINNETFFSWSYMAEWSRPSLKSFKTKREAVLTWSKAITLINWHSIFSEHISSFIVSHFVVFIPTVSNVRWTMIVFFVVLGLWVWNDDGCLELNWNLHQNGKFVQEEWVQSGQQVEVCSDRCVVLVYEVSLLRPT